MKNIDIEQVKKFLIEKEEKIKSQKATEKEKIIRKLKNLNSLWEKYNIKKIYLYGSFTGLGFQADSDIDLAIDGKIEFKKLLELIAETQKQFKREVDIRLLDEIPYKAKVLRTGAVVYERKYALTQK
jgi:predicted nucleotidyltransferase